MKQVAVLRGGPSDEYAVSMETGKGVLEALTELPYQTRDIVITRQGDWLHNGFVRQAHELLEGVDVVFIALHGQFGEDGKVQRILEQHNIPFTGSRALTSAIAFNKELTKQTLRPHGINLPRHRKITIAELPELKEEIPIIFSDVGSEAFIKPVASGSSLGAKYAPTEEALYDALTELLPIHEEIMVEEFIRGREATVGVLDNFRDEELYALPVVEIVPPNGKPLFDHEDKYSGQTEELVPGRFTYHEKALLSEAAALVHKTIDCKHYSRSDFIVRDGEVYFLEVNTLPGLTSESLFPKATAAIGLEYPQLIEHLIETASV